MGKTPITKEDQQRLLSLQLTGAWINVIREVPFEIVAALMGRIGRYPAKMLGGPAWFGLIANTNPWSSASKYRESFVLDPRPGWTLFHQPSGVSPEAENAGNLPPSYYENLVAGRDDEWVRVHVYSEWGDDLSGQAVFRRSFDPSMHVDTVNPLRPIMVAMDFGRTPTALICQVDVLGRLSAERSREPRPVDDDAVPVLSAHLTPERKVVQRGSAMSGGDKGIEVEQRVAVTVCAGGGGPDMRCMGAGDGCGAGLVRG